MGRIDALLPLRLWWAIPLAILLQMVAQTFIRTNEDLRWLKVALFMASYFIALAPAWANREWWGVRLLGLGIALNLLAMLANGGLMPITPEARVAAGLRAMPSPSDLGRMVPRTKNVLLSAEQTNLYPITDAIPLGPPVTKVISVGDILIVAGVVVLSGELAVSGWKERRRAVAALPEA